MRESNLSKSFMLDFENSANLYEEREESIEEWKALSVGNIEAIEEVRDLAKKNGSNLCYKTERRPPSSMCNQDKKPILFNYRQDSS